jgi:threonine aldolase
MGSATVDLRSDTVTLPTPAMRAAMAEAEVGDDQYGEDPTVRRLEQAYAERVGKERAVFVPSGTMANQLALGVLAGRGETVLCGRRQHVVVYEDGAAAAVSGVCLLTEDDDDGTIPILAVEWAIEAGRHHQLNPVAIAVENTHMASGGRCWPVDQLDEVCAAGLPVHVDGARLFNAEVATAVEAARIVRGATTVMTCLSKGLCAPVGSVLAGPADLMDAARRVRRRLGGAMRQSGILAAAGLVALETMVDRLAEDHERAKAIAAAVHERWPETRLTPDRLETNLVVFAHRDPAALLDHLAQRGVKGGTLGPGLVRLVTHAGVDDAAVRTAVQAIAAAP